MTTPKELADKAKRLAREYAHGFGYQSKLEMLDTTIDQLQAMAEARQGGGEPFGSLRTLSDGSEEFRRTGEPFTGTALGYTVQALHTGSPSSAQQATGSGQAQPEVPEGWVPGQAITEDMHVAACKVLTRANGLDGTPQRMLDAMLAAAPTTGKCEPLSEDAITDLWAEASQDRDDGINIHDFARAIEQAHGITGEQR